MENNLEIDLQQALKNSYRNYHAKGVDYLCVGRTPQLTQKIYFIDGFEGDVVVPHDHRYEFFFARSRR